MTNIRKTSRNWFWWAAAGALLLSEGFVFLRSLPEKSRWAETPVLTLDLPYDAARSDATGGQVSGNFHYLDQPERLQGAVEQLSFSSGRCGVFRPDETGDHSQRSLDFFFLEYAPGNPRFIHDVFGHAPEVCMRATGATLKKEHPSRHIEVAGRSLKVLVLEFVSPVSSSPLWVFRLTWLPEEAPFDPYDSANVLRERKLLSGIFGSPKPPARVLLAGAMGYENLEAAWESYGRLLVSRLKLAQQ
ncbi:MAG: hypothetical protein KA152_08130 [Verrucomicrobiales bacterium]|nr:hypothetical protein [Verrucomicrobiales bacterium]HQW28158.1 hypothetical protein [Verrucomicrobiales bacterium]